MIPADEGLAELHTHLGGSVASDERESDVRDPIAGYGAP